MPGSRDTGISNLGDVGFNAVISFFTFLLLAQSPLRPALAGPYQRAISFTPPRTSAASRYANEHLLAATFHPTRERPATATPVFRLVGTPFFASASGTDELSFLTISRPPSRRSPRSFLPLPSLGPLGALLTVLSPSPLPVLQLTILTPPLFFFAQRSSLVVQLHRRVPRTNAHRCARPYSLPHLRWALLAHLAYAFRWWSRRMRSAQATLRTSLGTAASSPRAPTHARRPAFASSSQAPCGTAASQSSATRAARHLHTTLCSQLHARLLPTTARHARLLLPATTGAYCVDFALSLASTCGHLYASFLLPATDTQHFARNAPVFSHRRARLLRSAAAVAYCAEFVPSFANERTCAMRAAGVEMTGLETWTCGRRRGLLVRIVAPRIFPCPWRSARLLSGCGLAVARRRRACLLLRAGDASAGLTLRAGWRRRGLIAAARAVLGIGFAGARGRRLALEMLAPLGNVPVLPRVRRGERATGWDCCGVTRAARRWMGAGVGTAWRCTRIEAGVRAAGVCRGCGWWRGRRDHQQALLWAALPGWGAGRDASSRILILRVVSSASVRAYDVGGVESTQVERKRKVEVLDARYCPRAYACARG
ncbi:hypothetical protein C8J57DRAFT_1514360 [Mycena rebaudengoi]|nr:hypothetical protein C8J57DRAFT_1514360 [Mycena rebaudengoi]